MAGILYVVDDLSFTTGGPRFLVDVLTRLANEFEIKIITGNIDSYANIHMLQKKNIDIINLRIYRQSVYPSSQPINALKFLTKSLKIINKIIHSKKYILHLNSHIPCLLAYQIRISNNRVPIICSLHHLEDISSLSAILPKVGKVFVQDLAEVNGPYDLIHTVSNFSKREIERISIVNKERIVVIPPGIELKKYLSVSKKVEGSEFVMIGRLEPRKHYHHAIFAVKYATKYNKDIKLYIIGDGPLRDIITKLIKRLSLEKNVHLLGRVDEETKLYLLSRAQALIHLGYPEGFGIVVIEALATGTPVIAFDIPPLNEIIKEGVTGVLVKKDDALSLGKVIANFDKFTFDTNILRKSVRKYDINIVANKFKKIYLKMLNKVCL